MPPDESVPPVMVVTSALALLALMLYEGITHTRFRWARITRAMTRRDPHKLVEVLSGAFGEHDMQWIQDTH